MGKMSIFSSNEHLFRKKKNESEENFIKKSIQIYRTDKFYKIITMYRTESWSYIVGKPVFLLPLDVTIQDFLNVILNALNQSRTISESEEFVIWNSKKEILKEIKEKSFDNLYKNSNSCEIYLENYEITLKPTLYLGYKDGVTTLDNKEIKYQFIENKYFDIIKSIIEILNGNG